MLRSRYLFWTALAIAALATLIAYLPGLSGPFLFDDHVHITQNRWVKIDNLDWHSLVQAWNSSFSEFPASRPLAQLSFGVTHALAGVDPVAFKGGNLLIHLLTGWAVYGLVRVVQSALATKTGGTPDSRWLAVVVAAVWLLHPLHVSTVLYAVQRMAQLSTLFLLLGLISYVSGRVRINRGKSGCMRMLAAAPLAGLGFLGKENAALMPLFLLSVELTVLAGMQAGSRKKCVQLIRIVFIAVPLVTAVAYVASHPGWLVYDAREFTLEQRLLTQARVLWTYVLWLAVPDISQFSLFHDDLPISKAWLDPKTTLPAVVALAAILIAALAFRKRAPIFAFAVLFFLAAHALESSIFPLEMVFEHRNYLASVGPLLLFCHVIMIAGRRYQVQRATQILGVLLLMAFAAATFVRADNWSSYERFVSSTVEHHPDSRRANFMAAQMLISALEHSGDNKATVAEVADSYIEQGLRLNPNCLDCLFARIALYLQLDTAPPRPVVEKLIAGLRDSKVGPTYVSVSQFGFLSRWHRSDGFKMAPADIHAIFDAALANPGWNKTGRASVATSYRVYHEFVSGDLAAAEMLARESVRTWPEQWGYHVHLIRVLRKRGHFAKATEALKQAAPILRNERQRQQFAELEAALARELPTEQHDTN